MAGQGLRQRHAYSLLALGEVKGLVDDAGKEYERPMKFVILRNPWGFGEWTGEWSDTDAQRTKPENNAAMMESFGLFELEGLQRQAKKTKYTYKRYNKEEIQTAVYESDGKTYQGEDIAKHFFDDKEEDEDQVTPHKIFKVQLDVNGDATNVIENQVDSVNWKSVLAHDKNDGTFMMTYDAFKGKPII